MSRFLLLGLVLVAMVASAVADPAAAPAAAAPAPAAPIRRAPAAVVKRFVGRSCNVKGVAGVCKAGGCAGTSVTGVCNGPSNIRCCIPQGATANVRDVPTASAGAATGAAALGATGAAGPVIPNVGDQGGAVKGKPAPLKGKQVMMPNGKPAPRGTPAGTFPWTFPYSQARHIVSDFNLQRIRLYDGANMVKEWKMSSGKFGIGFSDSIPATPCGKFNVIMKVGNKQPLGEIIEKLTPQHRIGNATDALAHMQTRILVLNGVDKNANYDNTNTRSRSIYIHGTNKEAQLGTMQSHGCFRMGNAEVIELFDAVQTGVEYFAVPFNAWPN